MTDHKLPEAHIAFLDEIFKANSSILNALLTRDQRAAFSQRPRTRFEVPLITMFGASNELPDEEELTALFDRFMLRFTADYIGEDFRFLKMLEGITPPANAPTISFAELGRIARAAGAIALPGGHHAARSPDCAATLPPSRSSRRTAAGATRSRFCARTPCSSAAAQVSEDDLLFLEHVLWKDPEELPKVRDAIRRLVKGFEDEARELLIQGQELREYAERGWESDGAA